MVSGRSRMWACLQVGLALAVLCGCSSLSDREDAVAAAARAFEADLARQDNAALCGALAPGTREELEDSSKTDCQQAIGDSDLPSAADVRRVDVYGRQARAVLDSDTLFLSAFPDGWKITAAGCDPQPRKPYKCVVKGA